MAGGNDCLIVGGHPSAPRAWSHPCTLGYLAWEMGSGPWGMDVLRGRCLPQGMGRERELWGLEQVQEREWGQEGAWWGT